MIKDLCDMIHISGYTLFVLWICLDVPDPPCEQDTGGLSDDEEQPQSGSDTEDEIERLGFVCMLVLVTCLFNSIFPGGRVMKVGGGGCEMELCHLSWVIIGTGETT
jgi:hypothetical protein